MTQLSRVSSSVEAFGHPVECTEPATGEVAQTATHGVTITPSGGASKQVASVATADISLPSHSHDYTVEEGCHQNESHTLDPSVVSSSITINGSPVYIVDDAVATDPTSGGNINIVDAGGNNSVSESP